MENEKRDQMKRSEKNQRYRSKKRKKMDRLLNILIGIVSILIVLNVISIFTGEDGNEQEKIAEHTTNKKDDSKKAMNKTDEENETNTEEMNDTAFVNTTNGDKELDNNESTTKVIVEASEDPIVDEVIVNPNWRVTPTQQTGEHVSTYTEGHIDYEEKLQTFSQAVQLEKENVIFWSVKNNGSPKSSVAVLSSNDANRTEKYRIYIEWIENEGWKPVKVEKLNQLAEAY